MQLRFASFAVINLRRDLHPQECARAGRTKGKGPRWREPLRRRRCSGAGTRVYAAFNHAAVSKALLISGMFMPKLGLVPFLGTTFTALTALAWATSVARSHDPNSWERATEKNRNT